MKKRVCDVAVEVLMETDNPSVMYGDDWLCHEIARRMGWEHEGYKTTRRVLAALARTPGVLVPSEVRSLSGSCARGQWVRCFELPQGADDDQVIE